jgi:molybdenum cofactor cytidylyltransferase
LSRRIAAIILAAGQSKRMGRPKMLLPWGSSTVLGKVVSSLADAGIEEIIVVTGARREKIEALIADLAHDFPVRSVHNSAYRTGEMLSSLQCGLAEPGPGVEAALITLGDQPQIRPDTVRSVRGNFETSLARIVVPSYRMQRGHPWLVARSLWSEIRALSPENTARDFLNEHALEISYVEIGSASILNDLDTPEDYQHADCD